MAQVTTLDLNGVMGPTRSFTAKTAASTGGYVDFTAITISNAVGGTKAIQNAVSGTADNENAVGGTAEIDP